MWLCYSSVNNKLVLAEPRVNVLTVPQVRLSLTSVEFLLFVVVVLFLVIANIFTDLKVYIIEHLLHYNNAETKPNS